MIRFIKRLMNPDKKLRITKVVIEGGGASKVVFESIAGAKETFLYTGQVWQWYETKHIIIPELSVRLDKAYKRWLRNNNRVMKGGSDGQ